MQKQKIDSTENLEKMAITTTNAFGSLWSVIIHTIVFLGAFAFIAMGADLNKILLVLTTLVSLEAIYLSIFIKMSANQQTKTLERVEKDMDEIVNDVEGIQKDVDEIVEDVEDIRTDVEEIQDKHDMEQKSKIITP